MSFFFKPKSVTFIDSFEDGDISEYAGDTGAYSVVDGSTSNAGSATHGSNVLEATETADIFAQIADTDSLTHPEKGDTFTFDINFPDPTGNTVSRFGGMTFACQSETATPESYLVQVDMGDSDPSLNLKYQDTSNNYTTFAVNNGMARHWDEWLTVEVSWNLDDSIDATIYRNDGTQFHSVSGTPSTVLSSGGIGWWYFRSAGMTAGEDGTHIYFDNATVQV